MRSDYYRAIIENSPIGYAYHKIILDQEAIPCDYEFIDVNSAFEKLTGLIRSEITGKKITEIIPDIKKERFEWIQIYGDIALNGTSIEFEQFSEPLQRWYKVNAYSPEIGYFITWFHDITKEKQDVEEKTIILTTMSDIIFELDHRCTFINIINSDAIKFYIPKETIIGKTIEEIFPDDLKALYSDALEKAVSTGEKQTIHYVLPIESEKRFYEADIFVKDYIFNQKKYIVCIREITERIKIEADLKTKTQELERFFEINLDLLCIADMQGNFIKVNHAWEDILGYPAAELETRKFLDFVHPEDLDSTLEVISRLRNNERVLYFINRYKSRDGSYRYIEWCSLPCGDKIYAAARDITARKLMEQELLISQERFNIALRGTRAGLWDWEIPNNKIYFSPQWKSMLGYEQDEIEDTFDGWKSLWHPDDKDRMEQAINDHLSGKTDQYEIDHRLRCKNGEYRWILTRGEAMKNDTGEIYRWVGTNIDISYLKEAENKILYLSLHDQLTGLYNRRFYEEELRRVDTERNLPLSLIIADVNGLKLANDAFGHLIGDELLRKTADVMKRECRADEIIARIGGDEFTIVLPKTNQQDAEILVKRIMEATRYEKAGILDLSISFGWATKTRTCENIEDIFKKAEENMYNNKLYESPKIKEKAITRMLNTVYDKYSEEKAHSVSVSHICGSIGKIVGFNQEELERVKKAGLFHDIGKISIREDVLCKAGMLEQSEWVEIKRHPVTGYQILNSVNATSHLAKYILHHHERWDGLGYPEGLKGEEIPFESRIIGIADAFHAMISERCYRKALKLEEALAEIRSHAGTQFDPELAGLFVDNIRTFQNISE